MSCKKQQIPTIEINSKKYKIMKIHKFELKYKYERKIGRGDQVMNNNIFNSI